MVITWNVSIQQTGEWGRFIMQNEPGGWREERLSFGARKIME